MKSNINSMQQRLSIFLWNSHSLAGSDLDSIKLRWLVLLRWCALVFYTLFATLSSYPGGSWWPYLIILSLATVNTLASRKLSPEPRYAPLLVSLHLALDLIAIHGIVYFSGGIISPLLLSFFLHAMLGGVLLNLQWGLSFLVMLHLSLFYHQLAYIEFTLLSDPRVLQLYSLQHCFLVIFWVVARSLGSLLEKYWQTNKAKEMKLQKQDQLRAIGAASSGFTHQLASPLNTVKIRLNRYHRYRREEDINEALNALVQCEEVIACMNSSQIDILERPFEKLDLSQLCKEVCEIWKKQNPEASLKVLCETLVAYTSSISFSQVILNLLDNAHQASRARKEKAQIQVSLSLDNMQRIQLEVTDNGTPFPTHILGFLGQPFNTSKPQGTGLGLYVVELFSLSHGGSWGVNNQPDNKKVWIHWPKKESL